MRKTLMERRRTWEKVRITKKEKRREGGRRPRKKSKKNTK